MTTQPNPTHPTADDPEPDVATLRLEVTDAGETWAVSSRFTHASPQQLADMMAAGAADVIRDAVEVVGRDHGADPIAQAHLALDMLRHLTRAVVNSTLDDLPPAVRGAAAIIAMTASLDSDDGDDDADEDTEAQA